MKNVRAVSIRIGSLLSLLCLASADLAAQGVEPTHFAKKVAPFLAQHCTDCHSGEDAEGGVALDRYVDSANIQQDYELWEKIIRLVKEPDASGRYAAAFGRGSDGSW